MRKSIYYDVLPTFIFPLHDYFKDFDLLRISLIFQVGRCDPNSDDSDSSISAFCSSKKYVMQSYYEKYEDLLDSDFQDFIAQELPFGLCKVLPHNLSLALRLSVLHRNLIGNGSHRHLTSSIRLEIERESILELPSHYCEVIIIERLPSGVFADPFELQHLLQRGGNCSFFILNPIIICCPGYRHISLILFLGNWIFLFPFMQCTAI